MSFQKCKSLKVSERVFDLVAEELDFDASENHVKIDGWFETFNNCREQGLVLFIDSVDFENENKTEGWLKVWVCEARNSDEILVITSTDRKDCNIHNMFSEEAYNNRKYFAYNEEHKAADYIINKVRETFAEEYGRK